MHWRLPAASGIRTSFAHLLEVKCNSQAQAGCAAPPGENHVGEKADDSLLARCREGDQQAAAELFRRYADRLIALARSRLSARLARRLDPEDAVHSAYRSFFADVREGRYHVEQGGD